MFAVGSYVGEVIRRHYGGEWRGNDEDPEGEINLGLVLPGGAIIWPVQRVLKRFHFRYPAGRRVMPWRIVERKIGRAGGDKQRAGRQPEWDRAYGTHNREVGYVVDGDFVL